MSGHFFILMSKFLLTSCTAEFFLAYGLHPAGHGSSVHFGGGRRESDLFGCCSVILLSWSWIAVVALCIASRTRSAESLRTSPVLPGLAVVGTEFPREVPVQLVLGWELILGGLSAVQ